VHEILRALCFALCVLHLIGSRWTELRFPERAPASGMPTLAQQGSPAPTRSIRPHRSRA
jgi:hypothetical protein